MKPRLEIAGKHDFVLQNVLDGIMSCFPENNCFKDNLNVRSVHS